MQELILRGQRNRLCCDDANGEGALDTGTDLGIFGHVRKFINGVASHVPHSNFPPFLIVHTRFLISAIRKLRKRVYRAGLTQEIEKEGEEES